MCGIVGFASKSNYRLDLNEVNKTYLHRGPDSQDFVYFKNCGLAMNRLSIIGIGEEGNQPMTDSSNRYTIVYNGEIFNSREIRSNLISLGYDFKTLNSDTEVVLASYIVYGDKCCSIFNGMFSFVIYDNINQTLFGAIDRFGIKPLNFIYKGDYFVFASEVKTLKSLNILTGKYNSESIINYFKLQYIPFEQTIYDGISKLLPGSFFSFDILENNLKFSKYFKPEFSNSRHVLDLNQFSYEFSSAVKRWSHSEVDLGLSLSGGLDSSLIASYCVKNSINFKAFTVFFKDKKYFNYNEINEAKRFANYLKIDLIEVPVDEEMVKNSFTDMLKALDEPYCGGVPSYFIYKKMKDVGLKVALTGVGGDELFGNYGKWDKYFKVNYVLRKYLKSMVNFDFNQISNFYGTVYSKYNSNSDIKSLFLNFRESDLESRISNLISSSSNLSKKNAIRLIDLQLQLPYEFLFMTDRLSMKNSIEARTPFLDNELIKYINTVDINELSSKYDYKIGLRKLFNFENPGFELSNSKKGFNVPDDMVYKAFNKEIEYLLSYDFIKKQDIFNFKYIDSNSFKANKNLYKSLVYFQLFYFNSI